MSELSHTPKHLWGLASQLGSQRCSLGDIFSCQHIRVCVTKKWWWSGHYQGDPIYLHGISVFQFHQKYKEILRPLWGTLCFLISNHWWSECLHNTIYTTARGNIVFLICEVMSLIRIFRYSVMRNIFVEGVESDGVRCQHSWKSMGCFICLI